MTKRPSNLKTLKLLVPTLLVGIYGVTEAGATVSYMISNPLVGTSTTSGYADLQEVNVSIDGGAINNAFAGGIMINETGGTVLGAPTSYTTVCTDISGTVYLGDTYQYNIPVPFTGGLTKLTGVAPSWGAVNTPSSVTASGINSVNAQQAIQNAAYIFYTFGNLNIYGITGTADQMAGLQLAVWEALYDTTTSGQVVVNGSSRFQVLAGGDATAIADANNYIASLNSQILVGDFNYSGDILVPNPATAQNGFPYLNANYDGEPPQELLFGVNNPQGSPVVPEPSSILAGAMLLLPLGGGTVRFLRNKLTV